MDNLISGANAEGATISFTPDTSHTTRLWTMNPPYRAADGLCFDVFRHPLHEVTLILGNGGVWSGFTSISRASEGLLGDFVIEKDLSPALAVKLAKALMKTA